MRMMFFYYEKIHKKTKYLLQLLENCYNIICVNVNATYRICICGGINIVIICEGRFFFTQMRKR